MNTVCFKRSPFQRRNESFSNALQTVDLLDAVARTPVVSESCSRFVLELALSKRCQYKETLMDTSKDQRKKSENCDPSTAV